MFFGKKKATEEVEIDLMKLLELHTWGLIPVRSPITDTGEYDLGWDVIEYRVDEPGGASIGHGSTPREAILDAIKGIVFGKEPGQ